MKSKHRDSYWASWEPQDLIPELKQRTREWVTFLKTSGYLERWQRNYSNFYGNATGTGASSNRLSSAGDAGELTTVMVNDYRSLIKHLVTLTTSDRPALKTKAANNDQESQQQTIVGDSLLEYALREGGAEADIKRSVERCLLYDEDFLLELWNTQKGDVARVDAETNAAYHTGDVDRFLCATWDVVRDPNLRTTNLPWVNVRIQQSRWDLIAQYPVFKEEILKAAGKEQYLPGVYTFAMPNQTASDDNVDIFMFLHEKTPAIPEGRLLMYVGDVALIDGPLPYDRVTKSRISPSDQDQSPLGYSDGNDLVGVQELKDALVSILATNNVTFGGQSLVCQATDVPTTSTIGEGSRLYTVKGDPTKALFPLQLTRSAPETYKFVETLDRKMETLSGVSSVVRGNPEASLKSGSALAIVEAQALRFISGLQESYNRFLESWGSNRIEIYQRYATEPLVLAIAGKDKRAYLRTINFTGDKISSIRRVQVEAISPMAKSFAGKLQMAESLLQNGKIDRPDEYFRVIETGRLDPLTHDKTASLLNISAENEALMEGRPVKAMISDDHQEHYLSHTALLDDPAIRLSTDPKIAAYREEIMAHAMEHATLLQQILKMNPLLLWLGKHAMPPNFGGPQPAQGPAPKPPGPLVSSVNNPESPVERQAQGVAMPKMPVNPSVTANGQRAAGPAQQ
jgi:hypothetical protein